MGFSKLVFGANLNLYSIACVLSLYSDKILPGSKSSTGRLPTKTSCFLKFLFKASLFFGQQAVGGEVRDHATHPVNVREQLLEEQTTEQGLGGYINGVPEYPNRLMELSAAVMSQCEVQELTQQSVGRRSYTSGMRQARGEVIVAPRMLMGVSLGPMQEIPLYHWQLARESREDAERRAQHLLYSQHLNGVHIRGGFGSAGDNEPLARDMYRGSNLEIGGERYPIQETNTAGPVQYTFTCSEAQQYPLNR